MANDLNYGHPGVATYDLDSNQWTFARNLSRNELKQLGSWNTVITAQTNLNASSNISTNVTTANRNVRGLVRDLPQLAPATDHIPHLAVVSSAIESTTSAYDPLVGDLLSFGSITFEGHFDHPRRVAALAAGDTGNILRLILLTKERCGWGGDKSIWLESSSMVDGESGYWNEDAAPIQQIAFAQSDDRSSILAVRLPTLTVLFHPTYHNSRRAPVRSQHYDLPASVVDAHPIFKIEMARTGGVVHMDVAFNPGFQSQFGIVDQQGAWSIWDIDVHRGDKYSVSCSVQGTILSPEDESPTIGDGWARILWVGNVNTIVACNRRQLSVFDIKGGSVTRLSCSKLISEHSPDWILDVKRHPRVENQFYVLTSTYIHVLAVNCLSDDLELITKAGATVLSSRRHYRGLEDFTLQLSVQMFSPEESCIILYSRLNPISTVFRSIDQDSTSPTSSASDPIPLDLTAINDKDAEGLHLVHLYLEPLLFGERDRSNLLGVGRSYLDNAVKFYRLSALLSDSSVRWTMLYSHDSEIEPGSPDHLTVEPTIWSTVIQPRRTLYATRDTRELEDFIVPDSLSSRSEPVLNIPSQISKSTSNDFFRESDVELDYQTLYDALINPKNWRDAELLAPRDALDVIAEAKDLLKDATYILQPHLEPPAGTLLEFGGAELKVSDVDEVSSILQDASSLDDPSGALKFRRIGSGKMLGLAGSEEPSISSLYDAILQSWIAPLPSNIPIRIRQSKELLARRIAVETILGSTRICRKELSVETQPDSSQDFPVFPTIPESSVPSSSQSLPPASSPLQPAPLDPITRLSKHLEFTKPFDARPTVPASVAQVLQHWQPGADPHSYEWEATERILQEEAPDEDSQAQREKARRKKERREKKQKREDEIFRNKTGEQPSSIPERMLRSSPGPMFPAAPSSSQIPYHSSQTQGFGAPGGFGGLLVQSQVEQGRHGGRPEKKKKKGKTRMSGF